MKRLIFCVWLMAIGMVSAYDKTVTIGDSAYFTFTHTSAIDSAQLILLRGSVADTLSLMPITGTSYKHVEWEDIFNVVDSAGSYRVWIEPYSSGAITDTILGTCMVIRNGNDEIYAEVNGLDGWAPMAGTDSIKLARMGIVNSTTVPAFSVQNNGGGDAVHFQTSSGPGQAGLRLEATQASGIGLLLSGLGSDMTGTFTTSNFTGVSAFWNEGKTGYALSAGGVDAIWDEDTTGHNTANSYSEMLEDTTVYQGAAASIDSSIISRIVGRKVWGLGSSGDDSSTLVQRMANMASISGDATAADNFKTMVDGTGGQTLSLGKLSISGANGAGGSFSILNSTGPGVYWYSSGNYPGAHIFSTGTGATADGILIEAGTGGRDIDATIDTVTYVDTVRGVSSSTGGGTEPETLRVLDTSDTTQVSGARVTVRTIDQSTIRVDGLITNTNGRLILDLDADSFFVATVMNNYQQALDTIVIAAGGQTDTIWVTPINPAAATAPNMCNAYIDTWAIVGDTVTGAKLEVTVYDYKPPYRDSDSSLIIVPREISAYTDTTGRATIGLVRSSEATDRNGDDVVYNFKLSKANYFSAEFNNRTVPDSSSWKIK